PDNPGIYLNRGNALRDAGEIDAAITDYRKALGIAPQYVGAHHNLGVAFLEGKGQPDEAIKEFQEVLRINQDDAMARTHLGMALQAKGQVDEATAAHREALRLKQDYALAHCNLGQALYSRGLRAEGIAEYREAIRLDKNLPQPHEGLGIALESEGQLD